jgi:DNA-binding PadR family transcriptional regulator
MGNAQIRGELGLKDRKYLREGYVEPALAAGWIEYTHPEKPNSRLQKYRLTDTGRAWLAAQPEESRPS